MYRKIWLGILLMVCLIPSTFADELSGDQIIAKVVDVMNSIDFKVTEEMTIIRPNKSNYVDKLEISGKGWDKVLVNFIAPPQDKGKAYLRSGNDTWYYLPSVNKSIRVSGNENIQGSDVSVDDIMRLNLTDDYSAKIIGQETIGGNQNYVLDLTAKPVSTITYGRLKYWVNQSNLLPTKFECYSKAGTLLKIIVYSEVGTVDGRTRPLRMDITSTLRSGYKTVLYLLSADFQAGNSVAIFNKMNLEKSK